MNDQGQFQHASSAEVLLKGRVDELETKLHALAQDYVKTIAEFKQVHIIHKSQLDNQHELIETLRSTISIQYDQLKDLNEKMVGHKLEIEQLRSAVSQPHKSDSSVEERLHTSSSTVSDSGTGLTKGVNTSIVRTTLTASSPSAPQTVAVICKKILLDGVVAELGPHFKCSFTPYAAEPPTEADSLHLPANTKVIVCLVVTTPRSVDANKLNQYLGKLTDKGMHVFVLFLVYGNDVPERKLDYPFGNLLYSKNLIDPSATVKFTYTKECHAALDLFINPKTTKKSTGYSMIH